MVGVVCCASGLIYSYSYSYSGGGRGRGRELGRERRLLGRALGDAGGEGASGGGGADGEFADAVMVDADDDLLGM